MEKNSKKEENKEINWLVIACIGGFCVFIILTFITLRVLLVPFNIVFKSSRTPETILEKASTIIDKATDNVLDEDKSKEDELEKSIDKVIEKITGEVKKEEIDEYNEYLEVYFGTNDGIDIKELIDEVIMRMKKNKEHTIKVIYKETTTSEIEELVALKKAFEDENKYEVMMDYDKKGYVYKITITDY